MASSMKASTYLGPDILKNSDICKKDIRFENIENVFNVTQRLIKRTFRRNSKCERLGRFITIMDEISNGQRPSCQIGEGKKFASTQIPSYVLVELTIFPRMLKTDGKVKLKISRWTHHVKMQWVSMDKQLNSRDKNFRIFNIDYSSRVPERLGEQEHPARGLLEPDHLHVNVQSTDDENCVSNA